MDTAIDFLYSNAEMYEPELSDMKTIIKNEENKNNSYTHNKIIRPVKSINPIRPKLTKESIIKKYSLSSTKKAISKSDEIFEMDFIEESTDFDFSFDTTRSSSR